MRRRGAGWLAMVQEYPEGDVASRPGSRRENDEKSPAAQLTLVLRHKISLRGNKLSLQRRK